MSAENVTYSTHAKFDLGRSPILQQTPFISEDEQAFHRGTQIKISWFLFSIQALTDEQRDDVFADKVRLELNKWDY